MEEGKFEEAASALRTCQYLRRDELREGHWLNAETNSLLGAALAAGGKFAQAEPLLLQGHVAMEENLSVPVHKKRQAIQRIVKLYESWHKPDQVSEWRQRLAETE